MFHVQVFYMCGIVCPAGHNLLVSEKMMVSRARVSRMKTVLNPFGYGDGQTCHIHGVFTGKVGCLLCL
jgi:hypothetical protein